jgi:hypothetical protein
MGLRSLQRRYGGNLSQVDIGFDLLTSDGGGRRSGSQEWLCQSE